MPSIRVTGAPRVAFGHHLLLCCGRVIYVDLTSTCEPLYIGYGLVVYVRSEYEHLLMCVLNLVVYGPSICYIMQHICIYELCVEIWHQSTGRLCPNFQFLN
jgi:hypothetical protein